MAPHPTYSDVAIRRKTEPDWTEVNFERLKKNQGKLQNGYMAALKHQGSIVTRYVFFWINVGSVQEDTERPHFETETKKTD